MTLDVQRDSESLKDKHTRRETGPNKDRGALRGKGAAEHADVIKVWLLRKGQTGTHAAMRIQDKIVRAFCPLQDGAGRDRGYSRTRPR